MAWINGHEIPLGIFAEVEKQKFGDTGNAAIVVNAINISSIHDIEGSEPIESEG